MLLYTMYVHYDLCVAEPADAPAHNVHYDLCVAEPADVPVHNAHYDLCVAEPADVPVPVSTIKFAEQHEVRLQYFLISIHRLY